MNKKLKKTNFLKTVICFQESLKTWQEFRLQMENILKGFILVTVPGINDPHRCCLKMHNQYIMQTTCLPTECRGLSHTLLLRSEVMVNS